MADSKRSTEIGFIGLLTIVIVAGVIGAVMERGRRS